MWVGSHAALYAGLEIIPYCCCCCCTSTNRIEDLTCLPTLTLCSLVVSGFVNEWSGVECTEIKYLVV